MAHEAATTTAGVGYGTVTQYIDPADYAVAGYTVQFRMVVNFQQNTVANAATSVTTVGIYPVTPNGTTTAWSTATGTVVAGSTCAQTGGAASSNVKVVSSPFTLTAGAYSIAAVVSVAARLGGGRQNCRLEYRLVPA